MLPNVILHNSISLDGSLTNFEVNMILHYEIAGRYKPDAHLIGSNTIKIGITSTQSNSQEQNSNSDCYRMFIHIHSPFHLFESTFYRN
jgi:2,5-diamino-6-(ribosylamino)-4(3H)-pyrimidinone 5'-phosphate reductase